MTRAAVLIVAAGEGRRFGGAKQFAPLGGRPVLAWSVAAFSRHPRVGEIVLVLPPGRDAAPFLSLDPKVRAAVDGGPRRQDSVRNGFARLAADGNGLVLVHDGVRPFVEAALVDRVLDAADAYGAAVPAVEIEDTVKEVLDGRVIRTLSRDGLVRVQTPQGFRYGILRDALDLAARATDLPVTDEASLVERLGRTVVVVPGDPRNIKITRAEDLALAEALRHD